jgi:hypothetical protein
MSSNLSRRTLLGGARPALDRMAGQAPREHAAGNTIPLDPDSLDK